MLQTWSSLSELTTRLPSTFVRSSRSVGFATIPNWYNVYSTEGGEFKGSSFRCLLEMFSIKDVCLTSKNPQSNAICEQLHQTVGNVLQTLVHTNPPQNMTQARDIIGDALASAMHAMRTAVATTLGSAPGLLAFERDMFLKLPLIADRQAIAHLCKHHVNDNL
jgi:hypothetical protein